MNASKPAPFDPKHPDGAPGSSKAQALGCLCPVIDNCYGKGYFGDGEEHGWVTVDGCPIHGIHSGWGAVSGC